MARRGALLLAAVALLAPSPAYAAWGKKSADSVKDSTVTTTADSSAKVVKSEQKYEEWSSFNTYWYNEVTGDVALEDPLVDFRGHTTPDGHTYWVDKITGESSWDVPSEFAWREENSTEHEGHVYFYNTVSKESTWERPAILGWKPAEKGFWHNNVTGESTWKQPEALGHRSPDSEEVYYIVNGVATWDPPSEFAWREVASTDPEHEGRAYFENWNTKEVTWDRPASLGWSRRSFNKTFWWNVVTGEAARSAPTDVFGFDDGQGNRFFIDPKTGESSWDRPAKAGWVEVHSEEHNRPYYYNNVTHEVLWEKPGDSNIAWIMYHEELR